MKKKEWYGVLCWFGLLFFVAMFSSCKRDEPAADEPVVRGGEGQKSRPPSAVMRDKQKGKGRPSGSPYLSLLPPGSDQKLGGGAELAPLEVDADRDGLLRRIKEGSLPRDEVLRLLDEAAEGGRGDLVALVEAVLQQFDPELRADALRALGDFSGAAVAEVLKRGLADADEEVRLAALEGAFGLSGSFLGSVVKEALFNDSVDVRMNAMDLMEDLPVALRMGLLVEAVRSGGPDVAVRALDEAVHDLDKRRVPDFFVALDSPHEEVREAAADLYDFHLNQTFESAAAARAWWQKHARRFDAELIETELEP